MKRLIFILFAVIIFMPNISYAVTDYDVTIDYKKVELKEPPKPFDGTIIVPLEEMVKYLGAEVSIDLENKKAVLTQKDKTININFGSPDYIVNGEKRRFSISPVIIGNIAKIAYKDLGDCLGYETYENTLVSTVIHFNKKWNYIIEKTLPFNSITINNKKGDYISPIIKMDGLIYVPLNEFVNNLGYSVNYDLEDEEKINIRTYDKKVNNTGYDEVKDKELKENGVVPDKETAYAIGKLLLEKSAGRTMEFTNKNGEFYLETTFKEQINCWCIAQCFKRNPNISPKGGGSGETMPYITINKNTGEVVSIKSDISFYEKLYRYK